MKSKLVKILLLMALVFSLIGFVATNPQFFNKSLGTESDKNVGEETRHGMESDENIEQSEFYKKDRRLETETFMKHQVGKIGDVIYYRLWNNEEAWIQVESCEIIKELTDELIDSINKNAKNGVDGARIHYKEDTLNLSEGKYSLLKITYRASFLGKDDLPYCYSVFTGMLYSSNEKMIYGEGTLVGTNNLRYVSNGQIREEHSNRFVFGNEDDNYFQILYLVPDRLIDEGGLYISGIQFDDYLSNAWKYDNSRYVIEISLEE